MIAFAIGAATAGVLVILFHWLSDMTYAKDLEVVLGAAMYLCVSVGIARLGMGLGIPTPLVACAALYWPAYYFVGRYAYEGVANHFARRRVLRRERGALPSG